MINPYKMKAIALFLWISTGFVAGTLWSQRMDPTNLGFKKKFAIEITNPSPISLENHPVILDATLIRELFPDFNTSNYAIFEEIGRDFRLVVSQLDDLDKDRIQDKIVLIKSLPAASSSTLLCFYSPSGSFQLVTTPTKAATRLSWDGTKASAGWESNLCAYSMVNGQIEFWSQFGPDLVLKNIAADMSPRQDWGMAAFEAGDTSGLGGLSLWDGATRIPLANPGAQDNVKMETAVISSGPLRALLRTKITATSPDGFERELSLLLSAFADNSYSRQDVVIQSESEASSIYGPGIPILPEENWLLDEKKGYASAWGEGIKGAGEIGLAVIFDPEDYVGLEESGSERIIRLRAEAGETSTYWILGGWEKGILAPLPPKFRNWSRRIESLAAKLLTPIEVRLRPLI